MGMREITEDHARNILDDNFEALDCACGKFGQRRGFLKLRECRQRRPRFRFSEPRKHTSILTTR